MWKKVILGFFKSYHDPQRGWMLKTYSIKLLRETTVEINDKEYNITPGFPKVFYKSTYDTAKPMNDTEKLVFRDILQKTGYYIRKPTEDCMSGRDRYIKNDLDEDVRKNLNLANKLKGRGFEKIVNPSNIIGIYTSFEILLGLKLSAILILLQKLLT